MTDTQDTIIVKEKILEIVRSAREGGKILHFDEISKKLNLSDEVAYNICKEMINEKILVLIWKPTIYMISNLNEVEGLEKI